MAPIARTSLVIESGGRRLAAERLTGAAAGPTLVFLHEGLGCIGFWKDFPEALCAAIGLPGFLWDRQGYGASDPPAEPRGVDYLAQEAERFLPPVLAAAGIERPILVGHSDGGTIALLHAAAFPDRVRAVVTLAAHVMVEEVTLAGIRTAVSAYEQGGLRRRLERFHGARTNAVFHAWADTWLSPGFRGWNVEARLLAVTAPLLVLQGAEDEYGTPAQVERILAGASGPARGQLLPSCGHAPHHQARDATLAAIAGFIRDLPGS